MRMQITTTLALVFLTHLATAQDPSVCAGKTLHSPKPQHLVCGAVLEPVPGSRATRAFLSSSNTESSEACADACGRISACQTFSYNPSKEVCNLYRKSGQRMGLQPSADGDTT